MSLFKHTQHMHKTQNINDLHDNSLTFGDRIADKVAAGMGSMKFIVIQSLFLAAWITWNTVPFLPHFDPMPFILLNLCLSFQAGYAAPFIMVSQNRQATKDRLAADHDYQVNLKNENRLVEALAHLSAQDNVITGNTEELLKQTRMLIELLQKIEAKP